MRRDSHSKRESRNKVIVGLFIVILMITSTVGFIVGFNSPSDQTDLSYNGFKFEQQGSQWVTEVETPFGEQEFSFFFHPLHLLINVPEEIPEAIRKTPTITLAFDPNATEIQFVDAARFQLSQYLITMGKNVRNVVTSDTTAYLFPTETCSPQDGNLYITFTESNVSTASIAANCITIEAATPSDHIQFSERIIYMLLGII